MSDTQAAMREFRFLDETRKTNGLTPAEEERWYELAQGLGVDVGQPQPQGYYAEDGNWYPYPAGYDPATGQYAAAAYLPAAQYPDYSQQQQAWYPPPQPQGYYGPDGNWYPYPPGYDPATGQYYPGYAPQPSYPPPQQWPMQQAPAQAWPAQPQPQYDHTTGQWGYPQQPVAPVDHSPDPLQYANPALQPAAEAPYEAEPQAYAPVSAPEPQAYAPVSAPEPQAYASSSAPEPQAYAPVSAPEPQAYASFSAPEPQQPEPALVQAEPVAPELASPLPSGLEASPVGEEGAVEVSSDEVMEIGDDEVSPMPSPSRSSPSSSGEALMASMRNALSFEDEPGPIAAELPLVEPEPSAEPPRSPELRVPEVSSGDFGSLDDQAPLTQNAPTFSPPVIDQEDTLPKGFDVSNLTSLLDDVPTRVYPANARKEEPVSEPFASSEPAPPKTFEPMLSSFDAFEKTPAEPFAAPQLGTLSSSVVPVPFDTDPLPTSENQIPDEGGGAESPPAVTPQEPPSPMTATSEPAQLGSALGGDGSEDDSPPTTIERMPLVPSFEDRAPDVLPLLTPPEADAPPRAMSALDALAIGPEVPLEAPALPLLEVETEAPEPSPGPAPPPLALQRPVSTGNTPVPSAAPPASHKSGFGSSSPSGSGFTDWSKVPIVESPAMQVIEANSAQLDDLPIPEEQPMDLSGGSNDRLELAPASDFVSYGNQAAQLDVDLNDSGDFQVDSASLAALATGVNEVSAPAEEEKMELVSPSEFINAPALTSTGERWAGSTAPARAVEPEEDGEIVQGIVLEDEAPVPVPELSPPRQEAELSWESSAPTRPSPPPMPFLKVVTAPSAPFAAPAPPPPVALTMPVSAYTPPPPPPAPLNTRVATPIAPPPPEPAPVPVPVPVPVPASDPFDRSGLSLGGLEPVQILVSGEHRVILHTVEGQVKRGSIREANLGGDTLVLEGASVENLPRARVKAIFFMLAPGARAPAADGDKVRVTFKDGRQVAGYSRDQKDAVLGFFVVPADNRTNTERIFIYRHAVQNVVVE